MNIGVALDVALCGDVIGQGGHFGLGEGFGACNAAEMNVVCMSQCGVVAITIKRVW
jgi:hypothetical protein